MERIAGTQGVGGWREGPRGAIQKRNEEAKFVVLGEIDGEKDFGDMGLKNRIGKRNRATEGFWNPTGKIEREGGVFYRHRFDNRGTDDQSLRKEEPMTYQRVWNARMWSRILFY